MGNKRGSALDTNTERVAEGGRTIEEHHTMQTLIQQHEYKCTQTQDANNGTFWVPQNGLLYLRSVGVWR